MEYLFINFSLFFSNVHKLSLHLDIRIKERSPKSAHGMKQHRTVILIYSDKVSLTLLSFYIHDLFNWQGLSVMSTSGSLLGEMLAIEGFFWSSVCFLLSEECLLFLPPNTWAWAWRQKHTLVKADEQFAPTAVSGLWGPLVWKRMINCLHLEKAKAFNSQMLYL